MKNTKMALDRKRIEIFLFCFIIFKFIVVIQCREKVTFTFPEYPYKDSSKNEMTFQEFESACDQSASCRQLIGVYRVRCIRECISPSCYRDIYMSDQLEEGEIDVRLNSFKGCFIQRLSRPRT